MRRAIELFEGGSAGTKNGGEDHLLEGILKAGLPEPQVNVRGITGVAGIEPDFAWAHARLVVELDGQGSHSLPQAAEQDRLRDERLREAGWRVERFSGLHVFHDRPDVVSCIARALGR